jgi:hypothetical protein
MGGDNSVGHVTRGTFTSANATDRNNALPAPPNNNTTRSKTKDTIQFRENDSCCSGASDLGDAFNSWGCFGKCAFVFFSILSLGALPIGMMIYYYFLPREKNT